MQTRSTEALSDGDLIERSLANPACFAVIFDRHADEILRYAHARLGPDLAEDVVAETFLAAFSRRDRYDTARADARPWLYGIAVRQIGRHRRAGARRPAPPEETEPVRERARARLEGVLGAPDGRRRGSGRRRRAGVVPGSGRPGRRQPAAQLHLAGHRHAPVQAGDGRSATR